MSWVQYFVVYFVVVARCSAREDYFVGPDAKWRQTRCCLSRNDRVVTWYQKEFQVGSDRYFVPQE